MPRYSRKDYKVVAEAILKNYNLRHRDVEPCQTELTLAGVALTLATVFSKDNPRFDAKKFIAACGLPEWASSITRQPSVNTKGK